MNKELTLQEALDMLNKCGTNINSQYEPQVLSLINNAMNKLFKITKPMKVKNETGGEFCPRCEHDSYGMGSINYCPDCGQRLDWSEFNE